MSAFAVLLFPCLVLPTSILAKSLNYCDRTPTAVYEDDARASAEHGTCSGMYSYAVLCEVALGATHELLAPDQEAPRKAKKA